MKWIIALIAFAVIYAIVQKSRKKDSGAHSGKTPSKSQRQKVINENIGWLKQRWNRIDKEKETGSLMSVGQWYFDPVTVNQLARLERMGLNIGGAEIAKGQASDLIGLFEPPEESDIAILQKRNIPADTLNETKAREAVARLQLKLEKVQITDDLSNLNIESHLIKQLPSEFIYFASFFDARIRYAETKPEYVPKVDHSRKQYEQAAQLGLALSGAEIPLEEKLKTFSLKEMSIFAKGKKFTRRVPAIEHLMGILDISDRLEKMAPNNDWFQLKPVKLDMIYLQDEWEKIHGPLDEYEDDYED
jgi:hypothetical protein